MNKRIKSLFGETLSHLNRWLDKQSRTRRMGNHVSDDVVYALRLAQLSTSHENYFLHRACGRHAIHDFPEIRSAIRSPRPWFR